MTSKYHQQAKVTKKKMKKSKLHKFLHEKASKSSKK